MRRKIPALLVSAALAVSLPKAWGVIVMGDQNGGNNYLIDGLPSASIQGINVSAYEGTLGGYVGTPIGSRYFVTAAHITSQTIGTTGTFSFYNNTPVATLYPVVLAAVSNDLAVWQIQASDPTNFLIYAPLYTSATETNQPMVVFGRGTTRGSVVQGGYAWGGGTSEMTWGTNTVYANNVAVGGTAGSYLQFQFARTTNAQGVVTDPNEAILSAGDSGGGVFVYDPVDQSYELAGIGDYVDRLYDPTTKKWDIHDALYDARGYWNVVNGIPTQYSGANPIPLSSYAAQVSASISFLNNTIGRPTEYWYGSTGNHSWNSGGNWGNSTVLTGQSAVAFFPSSGAGAVTLDGNQTVGKIYFDSTAAYNISQGSGGVLTIDDSTDTLVSPQIDVDTGSHSISAPMSLANGVNINFQNGSALTVSNSIGGSGPITVNGHGTLMVAAGGVLPGGSALSITSGAKVALARGASQTIASLSIDTANGSALDIGTDTLNITGTPASTIESYLAAGVAGGAGIVSSESSMRYGVGYISQGSGTLVRYTLYGDTNLDGTVNFSDLLALATSLGNTASTWATGDFTYNGTTNFTDLLMLTANYGLSLTPSESSQVTPAFAADWNLAPAETSAALPEPGWGVVVVVGGVVMGREASKGSGFKGLKVREGLALPT